MDLKKILDEHLLWLNGEGGSCANLFGANLRGANLSDADLRLSLIHILWSWKSPQMHAGPPLLAENAAPVRPRY